MQYVSLVTLLLVIQYLIFTMMVGAARSKSGIKAPAVTGDEQFERAYRVQMNTLEMKAVCLLSGGASALIIARKTMFSNGLNGASIISSTTGLHVM